MTALRLKVEDGGDSHQLEAVIDKLIVAGWTGRNPVAMEAHIVELEKLGVPRPKSTPIFYRTASSLLTTADEIEVVGPSSSGEVEPVVFSTESGLWLGVGSDHTDRQVETIGITISKQLCAKPVASAVWSFASIADHWDELIVRSWAVIDGRRRLYQEGTLANMRQPSDLLSLYGGSGFVLPPRSAMFCGTLAVHGEIQAADSFEMEIEDPKANRKISHAYRVNVLPIEG